jgi:hypothetical protein
MSLYIKTCDSYCHNPGEKLIVIFLPFVWTPMRMNRKITFHTAWRVRSIFMDKRAKRNATRKPQPSPSGPSYGLDRRAAQVTYCRLRALSNRAIRGSDTEYMIYIYISGAETFPLPCTHHIFM